jgi:hypothetical protein
MPRVLHTGGKAVGQATRAVEAPEQEGPKVGRHGPACDISPHGISSERRKTQVFWRRRQPTQTSWSFYGMDGSHFPFYPRLTRGLCFFVKNPG